MSMMRCKADLHFYDVDKYDSCPFCRHLDGEKAHDQGLTESDLPETIAVVGPRSGAGKGDGQPARQRGEEVGLARSPSGASAPMESSTSQPTVQLKDVTGKPVQECDASNPVVGWLVRMDGFERGRDYRIKAGTNEIGSQDDPEVDIVITGDSLISRRYHAEILYDPEENVFYLIQKKNEALKVNDSRVRRPTRLNPYDIIQLGETRLVFVPLCSERFQWPTGR